MSDTIVIEDKELVRRLEMDNAMLRTELAHERRKLAWEDRQHHHDILRDVIKSGVEAALAGRIDGTTQAAQLVAVARKHADLAYPPPKDEP